MQKFIIIKDFISNMEVFKVVNLNNITIDVAFINENNACQTYKELAVKYKVN